MTEPTEPGRDYIITGPDGMPEAFLNIEQLTTDATKLAFRAALATTDAEYNAAQLEYLDKYGPDGFGLVATNALQFLVKNLFWPALDVARESAGVDLRDGMRAIAAGDSPPPLDLPFRVIVRGGWRPEWVHVIFRDLFDYESRSTLKGFDPGVELNAEQRMELASNLKRMSDLTGVDVEELRSQTYPEWLRQTAHNTVDIEVNNLISWARDTGRDDLLRTTWMGFLDDEV